MASTSTESNQQGSTENVSSTEKSEVARPTASLPIVGLNDYDTVEETVHNNQKNHLIERPKIVNVQAEKNLKKADFNFMVDFKTLMHKTLVDPKLLKLKICSRNNQKEWARKQFSPVSTKLTERLRLLIAAEKL